MANSTDVVRFYVKNEEIFDIMHSIHTAISHGGHDRMMVELKLKYFNITKK